MLASVAVLILFAGSSAFAVRAYVLYERANSTTSSVIAASNDLLIALLNAETGQRGYLLTNKPIYLQPYDRRSRRSQPTSSVSARRSQRSLAARNIS